VKLLTVDVESPLPDVPPATLGEAWILVRLHREPLGILRLGRDGYTAQQLARLVTERFAQRIQRHLVGDSLASSTSTDLSRIPSHCPRRREVPLPSVTVAVCTRDGAARLSQCLDALLDIKYPAERLDLLVVDNAPRDASTRELIERDYPAMRYVVEPQRGLDRARNRAIMSSGSEIVAFTDDDVSVDSGWVEAIGRLFAGEPDVDAVTGLVVPDEMDVEAQRLFEEYGGFSRGFDRRYERVDTASGERAARRHGGAGRFGTGANMAFRRKVFDRIGLFDPALDVGTPTNGGGDLEMFFRVLKEGGTLVYEPAAIVRHRHRRIYDALRTQLTNNGIGFYAYLVRSAIHYPDERAAFLRLGAWWLWWWNLRRLAQTFVSSSAYPRDLVLAELRGSLIGLGRYQESLRALEPAPGGDR
jgi:GT2 family glycosyltransferase